MLKREWGAESNRTYSSLVKLQPRCQFAVKDLTLGRTLMLMMIIHGIE